jgi:hypothetical protein
MVFLCYEYQPDVLSNNWDFKEFEEKYLKQYPRPHIECVGKIYDDSIFSKCVIKNVMDDMLTQLEQP